MRLTAATAVLASIALACSVPHASASGDRFADVPEPGHPEGIVVTGQHVVVGTGASVTASVSSDGRASRLFWYDRRDGGLVAQATVSGQDLSRPHALLGLASDRAGRVYAAERGDFLLPGDGTPARVLRFTRKGSAVLQEVWATVPDVGCAAPLTCPLSLSGRRPVPNALAFLSDGSALLTDSTQAAVWRVPSGGGTATPWLVDPRLDSPLGPNGLAVDEQRGVAYLSSTPVGGAGCAWSVRLVAKPSAQDLRPLHCWTGEGLIPDGLALGARGDVYVALASADAVAVLTPEGRETRRLTASSLSSPANLAFDGRGRLLVTNQDFTGTSTTGTVTALQVGDPGRGPHQP